MRSVDFSKGEAMKASAASATDATLASMGIKNMEAHDGMATMDWMDLNQSVNDVGITVPGSKSTQKFVETTVGALDPAVHNIVLKLVGDLGNNKPVTKPVTVAHKPKCVTCGKQNKAHAKFCVECGTALEIFA
jgi:rRNA maturation endonuclease Nob1